MAISRQKNKSSSRSDDSELLQSEVATFASSLGLSSSLPSSSSAAGFNDSDFRKPIENPKNDKKKKKKDVKLDNGDSKKKNVKFDNKEEKELRPAAAKQRIAQTQLSVDNSRMFDKYKNLPRLPLMKASSLGVWYEDAAELEEKLIGGKKKVEFKNVEEWKGLVEKKKELAERLLAQYVNDYESSRGQSGDIKMVFATQRSGTVTDKVSAFSVLVGDNPIANIKSIDALLGIYIPNKIPFSEFIEFFHVKLVMLLLVQKK